MKEDAGFMGAAFCGAAVGVVQAIQQESVVSAPLLLGILKMAGYVISGVLVFGALFFIGVQAEKCFVREADGRAACTWKRVGILVVWSVVVCVLAGLAGVGK